MKTISIINLKGWVAKTISAINIAFTLVVVHGKRVLLIDNDKQGNTSNFFRLYDPNSNGLSELLTSH
ncbi:ParA family protein [Lysinibacillus sp. NPDC047702]|uniref:ParA family protein n=1 Tax=unclassified Lysinibacillus TaxID=2636778 RepID=UPI003D00271F